MIDLNSTAFHDKVYGCWMGKNCGGTLGAPLERAWGNPELFDVWWYPELREGGIPNDDLEMQLIWLKALEEIGPSLRAADLAQYWLDHIGYNFDEYGLSKTNLRLGLLPPVSGAYNNWFKDCMGCPIRSEIWACIAPGVPRVAVRYAYEDAICDHAGGESVFGELFNTAVESAAFVVSDREQLIDIGMSYIPESSRTAQAINAARAAYATGEDWKTARQRVLEATPHYNAQYSPINLGFQVLGWLYGEEFGDAICKTVNCGYDTDCTGATVGSILGIILGRHGLPQKWTEPLGETIATNESWGGLRHTSDGANPVPPTLDELTERVCVQAQRVLAAHGMLTDGTAFEVDLASLYADASVHALWSANPMRVDFDAGSLRVGVEYVDSPAAVPHTSKRIVTHIANPHPDLIRAQCTLRLPDGWPAAPDQREVEVPPHDSVALAWDVPIPSPTQLENSNQLAVLVQAEQRPMQPSTPIVLVGAHAYRFSGPYPADERTDRELFEQHFAPEQASGDITAPDGRPGVWTTRYAADNALPLSDVFDTSGVLYAQTFLFSSNDQEAWMGIATTCPAKMWVNQQPAVQSFRYRPLRPNYAGDHESYAVVKLKAGWNEVLLKFVRAPEALPFAAHLMISSADKFRNGLDQVGRTRFPWDKQ